MDDEVILILLAVLVVLGIPACAIFALRIALSSRRMIVALQLRVEALEAGARRTEAAALPEAASESPEPDRPSLSDEQADIEEAVARALGSVPSIPRVEAEPGSPHAWRSRG